MPRRAYGKEKPPKGSGRCRLNRLGGFLPLAERRCQCCHCSAISTFFTSHVAAEVLVDS